MSYKGNNFKLQTGYATFELIFNTTSTGLYKIFNSKEFSGHFFPLYARVYYISDKDYSDYAYASCGWDSTYTGSPSTRYNNWFSNKQFGYGGIGPYYINGTAQDFQLTSEGAGASAPKLRIPCPKEYDPYFEVTSVSGNFTAKFIIGGFFVGSDGNYEL